MNEPETRRKFIDKQLKVFWYDKYVKREVNSVKSNFKNKQYVLLEGKVEHGVDRFIDYLLLGEDDSPLAIIEAKKFSKDQNEGRIQARTYQEDIKAQTGKIIPIFLTNGDIWIFIDQHGRERKVSGPFSQEDLDRRNDLFEKEKDPSIIFTKIVDRDRSKLNVKKLSEHFAKGHRSALVQMATGTGKTRVAMAVIDILVKANYIRNVLFVVDRITLADDAAEDGFKRYFSEPVRKLHREGFSTTARFYTSTVQTLMGKGNNRMIDKFSPGFFDLIIFDEAHRSQYDKRQYLHEYFDAIRIGLTATPREEETKNTYDLFDCENGEPTVEYTYDEAVSDRVLVPYVPIVIETENLKEGISGKRLPANLKDQLRQQEVDPERFEVQGSHFERVFLNDKTNEVIINEFMNNCYKSAEGLPCKSIFFCRSQRHAKNMKRIFGKLYPNLSSNVQVITSSFYRAGDEVKRFKQKSEPRIALSVGMLDTGVDIPEVCNLIFIGPIFSPIRFWQMLGRGTRNYQACCGVGKHREWLPVEDGTLNKKDFLLFDVQLSEDSNIKLHHLNKTKERTPSKDIISSIFDNRVKLLTKELTPQQKKIVVDKILTDINSLNEESFIVREKRSLIKKLRGTFDLDKYVKELHEEIKPLMVMLSAKDPKVTPFILQVEKLFNAIVESNPEQIDKIRDYVKIRLENILAKETKINAIKAKKDIIIKVLNDAFWEGLTFEKVEIILKELSPLIKYYEEEPGVPIQIDKPDIVISRTRYVYQVKEDPKMVEFIKTNPIVRKIKDGEGITCLELRELEIVLTKLNSSYTIENIQEQLRKDFLVFLHEIIGLTKEYDPKELIEREFDKYVMDKTNYNSRQLEFLLMLKKVFANRKYIDIKDLAKDPFKDENPVELFNGVEELQKIVTKCQQIKMK